MSIRVLMYWLLLITPHIVDKPREIHEVYLFQHRRLEISMDLKINNINICFSNYQVRKKMIKV